MIRVWSGVVLFIGWFSLQADAGDWPQVLGPNRNGIAIGENQVARIWPRVLPVLWARPVGAGRAGVATQGNRGVLFHRYGEKDFVEGFDLATGQALWSDASPVVLSPGGNRDDGPYCVPTITGDRVVTLGPQGLLTCNHLETGERIWQRNTAIDFRALDGPLQIAGSPLVAGEIIVMNVGGTRAGAGIVGFSLATGDTEWSVTRESTGDAAPISVKMLEQELVLLVSRDQCLLMAPANGGIYFQFPVPSHRLMANAPLPVVNDDHLLLVGQGARYSRFDLLGNYPLWQSKRGLVDVSCTPIVRDGHAYFIDGRDSPPPADLRCLNLATGKVRWSEQNFGEGSMILTEDQLLVMKANGELVQIELDPKECRIVSRVQVLRGTVGAFPALSGGRLFVRNSNEMKCVDLSAGRSRTTGKEPRVEGRSDGK